MLHAIWQEKQQFANDEKKFHSPYGQNSRGARCPTHELLNFTSIAGS